MDLWFAQHYALKHLLANLGEMVIWCKDYTPTEQHPEGEGKMLLISEGYTEVFGPGWDDYVGFDDIYVWGPEIGKIFQARDRETFAEPGKIYSGTEECTSNRFRIAENIPPAWRVVEASKWSYWCNDGQTKRRLVYGRAKPAG